MNQYLTKAEILDRYYSIHMDGLEYELDFIEGGKVVRVMTYASLSEAVAFYEEDSLAHWMKALKRTWNDDEFKEEVETFEPRHRREPREEL